MFTGAPQRWEELPSGHMVEACMPSLAKEERVVLMASKGRRTVHRKMGRGNVWKTNVRHALQRQWDTENFGQTSPAVSPRPTTSGPHSYLSPLASAPFLDQALLPKFLGS